MPHAIPGPRGRLFVGSLADFRRDAPNFLRQVALDYGDVARVRVGPVNMVLVSHPDLIEEVLVAAHSRYAKYGMQRAKALIGEGLLTSEGAHHDHQRRLADAAFSPAHLARLAETMTTGIDEATAAWRQGTEVDLVPAMLDLTARVIGRAVLGPLDPPTLAAVAADLTTQLTWLNQYPDPLAFLDRLPLPANRAMPRARARLIALVIQAIKVRRAERGTVGGQTDHADLLTWLGDAVEGGTGEVGGAGVVGGAAIVGGAAVVGVAADGVGMTDAALAEEALTLLMAAHERAAMALTWCWYLLAKHPEVQDRLQSELDGILGGRPPAAEDLGRLSYTQRVIREALRRFPPVWIFARRPLADVELGGYRLPAGTPVFFSQYVVHHDPRWYAQPFRFDPDRWTGEPVAQDAPPAGAYFPFGRGPRSCLGEHFARTECAMALAVLAQRWRLLAVPGSEPVALLPTITLRPKRPIHVQLEERR